MGAFFTKTKVESIEDFAGLKIAVPSPAYLPFVVALKATPVVINMPDYYTAMERGTVDGYHLAPPGVEGFGLIPVTKYMIDEKMGSSGAGFMMNLDKWNSLPKHLQDVIMEVVLETEAEGVPIMHNIYEDVKQKLEQAGAEIVKFSPEEAERFQEIRREAIWAAEIERHPEICTEFKKLIVP